MTNEEIQRLIERKVIQRTKPDPITARSEIQTALVHIESAKKIMADDPNLAFTALYDAMRKSVTAHMRSNGLRVTKGAGAHKKTGEYAVVALAHLDIGHHLDEFDALRNLRNQSEYEALYVQPDDVSDALEHVRIIVESIGNEV